MHTLMPPWITPQMIEGAAASPVVPQKKIVWNRTGGATVQYGLYAFDMGYTAAAETVANSAGLALPAVSNFFWEDSASCWKNIVTPASPFNVMGFFCIAMQAVADNEPLEVVVVGDTFMRIGGYLGFDIAFTGANWTDASKTLTKTGAFVNFLGLTTGQATVQVNLTAGTGVTPGLYTIASKTSNNAVVLATDINGAGGDIGDASIAGAVETVWSAGAKIQAVNGSAFGNINDGSDFNRRLAYLKADTRFTAAGLTTGGGQVAAVIFSGWGLHSVRA